MGSLASVIAVITAPYASRVLQLEGNMACVLTDDPQSIAWMDTHPLLTSISFNSFTQRKAKSHSKSFVSLKVDLFKPFQKIKIWLLWVQKLTCSNKFNDTYLCSIYYIHTHTVGFKGQGH